ncbi:MAG: M56 family metallopeptidase [Gammaproteobacteria bacterium]
MKAAETLFNLPLMQCLGWTLVHFLWQGIVVGVIYIGVRQTLRGKSPASRYHLAMGTLAVMAVLPIITYIHLANTFTGIAADENLHSLYPALTLYSRQDTITAFFLLGRIQNLLQQLIPWTVPFWLLGVCATLMRVLRGWRHAYQLRETAIFIPLQEWYAVINSICVLFGINKIVRLAVSTKVSVPSVVGWLKPIILIPPSSIAGLTPLQMELILAHELAHIRRQDYLWNLMQIAIETVLFYHPVVHWVSQQARIEREQCCDDMVVEKNGNAVEYARALTELETLRHAHGALLMGANGGQILNRIHRLIGVSVSDAPIFWLPLFLIAGFLISASFVQATHQKIALQSVLSSKFSLLADVRQTDVAAPATFSIPELSPTQIYMTAKARPTNFKPVQILDSSIGVVLRRLPGLAETIYSVEPNAHSPASAVRIVSTQNLKPATVIENHAPVYPALAVERGIEGSATVAFTLTSEGNIIDMHVTQVSGSRLFGQTAIAALRHWRISPATLGGVPVTQHMAEEFIFQLRAPATKSGACEIPIGYHVCTSN